MQSVLPTGSPVRYAFRFRDKMCLWQPPRPVLQKLAAMSALRQRLLRIRQQLRQPLNEQQGFVEKSVQKQLVKNCQASLKAINTDLATAEKQINELIQSDDRLKEPHGRPRFRSDHFCSWRWECHCG
ncbi:hypothetical protein [Spirosoma fluviale]|uniref:hypothetical protein n=1 Tax=Spirosoma fluviale TaxID=1597977 RepID=UPI001FE6B07C|nr:hypothetical protein [Spirosoma fluviale]